MNRRKPAISTAAVAAAAAGSGLSSIEAEAPQTPGGRLRPQSRSRRGRKRNPEALAAFQGDDRQDVQGNEAGFPAAVQSAEGSAKRPRDPARRRRLQSIREPSVARYQRPSSTSSWATASASASSIRQASARRRERRCSPDSPSSGQIRNDRRIVGRLSRLRQRLAARRLDRRRGFETERLQRGAAPATPPNSNGSDLECRGRVYARDQRPHTAAPEGKQVSDLAALVGNIAERSVEARPTLGIDLLLRSSANFLPTGRPQFQK